LTRPYDISNAQLRAGNIWPNALRARLTPSTYTFTPGKPPTSTIGQAFTTGNRVYRPKRTTGWFGAFPNLELSGNVTLTYWNIVIDNFLPDETNVLTKDQYIRAIVNCLDYHYNRGKSVIVDLPVWDANTSPATFLLTDWWLDIIAAVDDHPATYGYYLFDEPELQGELPGDTRPIFTHQFGLNLYNMVKTVTSKDAYSVFAVTTWFNEKFAGRTPFWDVFMFDLYPWLTQTEVDARFLVNPTYDYTINTQGELDFIRNQISTWLPIVANESRYLYLGQGFGGTQTNPYTGASETVTFPAYREPTANQFEYVTALLEELFPRAEGYLFWDYTYGNANTRSRGNDELNRWRDNPTQIYTADPIRFVAPPAGTYNGCYLETIGGQAVAWIGFDTNLTGTGADVTVSVGDNTYIVWTYPVQYDEWMRFRNGLNVGEVITFGRQSSGAVTFDMNYIGFIRGVRLASQYAYLFGDRSFETERAFQWATGNVVALTDGFGNPLNVTGEPFLRDVNNSSWVVPFTVTGVGTIRGLVVPELTVSDDTERAYTAGTDAPELLVSRTSTTEADVTVRAWRNGYTLRLYRSEVLAGVYGRYTFLIDLTTPASVPWEDTSLVAGRNYKYKAVWVAGSELSALSRPEITVNYLQP
jgi:hypothetical protein